MTDDVVVVGDPDVCTTCGRSIGRAGRSDAVLLAAVKDGSFATSFGCIDWTQDPPTQSNYCRSCYQAR